MFVRARQEHGMDPVEGLRELVPTPVEAEERQHVCVDDGVWEGGRSLYILGRVT